MNAPHGSAAGYEAGCHESASCANAGSLDWLTCEEAAIARRGDYSIAKLPADQPIAKTLREIPRAVRKTPVETAAAPAAEEAPAAAAHAPAAAESKLERAVDETPRPAAAPAAEEAPAAAAHAPAAAESKLERADDETPRPAARRRLSATPERSASTRSARRAPADATSEDWVKPSTLTQSTPAGRPEKPARSSVAAERKPAAVRAARPTKERRPRERRSPHGRTYGWQLGCRDESKCPEAIAGRRSCTQARREYREAYMARRRAEADRIEHGTLMGYQLGCRDESKCPEAIAGRRSCTEARRRYHADYMAKRRAKPDDRIKHGTAGGYQLGCHDRTQCPGGPDGLSCSDASLAAERRRRRDRGIQEAAPRVSSAPAIAHIAQLRDAGLTIADIIDRSGVSRTAIRTLIYGRDDYINGTTGPRHGKIPEHIEAAKAAKILAVKIPVSV